ncbi:MAG: hypothetical protein SGILL_004843 [Bacillariaceae sp.]
MGVVATPDLQQMLMGQQQNLPHTGPPPANNNAMADFLALVKANAAGAGNDRASNSNTTAPPATAKPPQIAKTKRARRKNTFPEKLMQAMLDNEDEQILAWLPDGRSFVIVDPDLFCERVLKETFKEVKYPSFVRKLHRWGFVRLTSGTGTDCFYHPLFQKKNIELAKSIQALSRTGGKLDVPSSASAKPPSLAGVEKFIKSTIASSAAASTLSSIASKERGEEKTADEEKSADEEETTE